MSTILEGISYPLYQGTVASPPGGPYNLPISIGDHRYQVDWSKFQRTTISPYREARDSGALPGENSLNPLAAWKRSRDDWSLGAGQTWADRFLDPLTTVVREIEPRRFYDSIGIDPWTIGQFKLLPDTETAVSIGAASGIKMLTLGTYVYWIEGANVKRTANIDAVSPTVATLTGFTGTPQAITTDGATLYLSTTVGMFTSNPSGTTCTAMAGAAATYQPTTLRWMNGWLFGCVGNVISEVRAAGTVNTVFTHLNSNFVFSVIEGTPICAYFGGNTTDVNEIWRVAVKTDGTLGPGLFSGSLPKGELIRSMAYYSGYVLLGSNKGVRLAIQRSDGSLDAASIISTTADVRTMAAEGRFVWFNWDSFRSTQSGLGRMDLSAFTDQNNTVPAYASDLMMSTAPAVTSVIRFGGKTYFAADGVGIIRQHASRYVASGTLTMGRFRWATFEPKVWLGIEVASDPLTGANDGTIAMTVADDSGVSTSLGSRGPTNGSTGVGTIYGVGTVPQCHDWFQPVITLSRAGAGGDESPIVRRVTLRALPVPKTIEQYSIPIMMAEKVNDNTGEGGEVAYDTAAEYTYLQGLIAAGAPVTFRFGLEAHLVTVREVGWDNVYGMTSKRSGVNGTLMVTLISAEI